MNLTELLISLGIIAILATLLIGNATCDWFGACIW